MYHADIVSFAEVVLLDEAEVFLEQRSLVHLERNALVSGENGYYCQLLQFSSDVCSFSTDGGIL